MERIGAILLPVVLGAFLGGPAIAQRGGHSGGFAHGGAGFRGSFGGFSAAAPPAFRSPSGTLFRGSFQGRRTFSPLPAGFGQTYRAGSPEVYRHPYRGNRFRRYRGSYRYGYSGYLIPSYLGYGLPLDYGLPFDYGDYDQEDQGAYQAGALAESSQEALPQQSWGEPPPPEGRPEYQREAAPVHAQPATLLIFNDGRVQEKVHNYVLTGTTLYALDGDARKEIPLSELNVPATVKANRSVGVDFALPVSGR